MCPFREGESWVPIVHNDAWAEFYLRTKWHFDLFRRLATIDMGRKVGATLSIFWREVRGIWREVRGNWVPI